jgi:tetratricopeptide (TPR) repeat protein
MLSNKTGLRLVLTFAALALAGTVRAEDDKALRQQVLALNQVTGDDPLRGQILALVEDKANTPKLLAVAVKIAGEKDQPLNFNAGYILARTAQLLKDSDTTRAMYRVCIDQAKKLKSPTKLFDAYRGLIADYYIANKYDDALKICQEFLDLSPEKLAASDDLETPKYNDTLRRAQDLIRREQIQIYVKVGKLDEANKTVDAMLKKDPDDMEAMEVRALVQRESGDYTAAAKTYEEMIKKVNDAIDKVKKTDAAKEVKESFIKQFSADVRDYRYILSGLYIDAKDVNKAADELKTLIKEDPDNPSYNNDLGYVWADHDMNLAEAEKLIRKAIEDDKKKQAKEKPELKPEEVKANPSYLDSLGWVLFKEKKYKDALPPLLEAVKEEEGKNIEIYDHLAEVHMALGDKAAALDAWKKGLEASKKRLEEVGPSKREQDKKVEVEKKIKANQ